MNKTAKYNHSWCEETIKQLVHQGIRHFCIAPGSRCTPLVIAIDAHPLAVPHLHYDERGLGFFALGLAKAIHEPIALVVTSGTAVANLFPAIIEAYQAHIPLIILTADRPADLRDCKANQTIDQVKIFGNYVHYFFDFPSPSDEVPLSLIKTQVAQALHFSLLKQGPVHLNFMLKEPFFEIPLPCRFSSSSNELKNKVKNILPSLFLSQEDSTYFSDLLNQSKKGLIIIGNVNREKDLAAIESLSHKLGFPILAEASSSAHLYLDDFIAHFDLIIKKMKNQVELEPEHILIFGDIVISKTLLEWLKELKLDVCIQVSQTPSFFDPIHATTHKATCDIDSFCNQVNVQLAERKENSYLSKWTTLSNTCKTLIRDLKNEEAAEWLFTHHILKKTEGMPLFIANSMPIRYVNMLYSPSIRTGPVFCNRGVSGIDGNIATVAGIGKGLNRPIAAILGDTTTLHDLNSIHLLLSTPGAHLFVMNNHGGTIFSHLPVKQLKDIHHKYFYNHHPYHFEEIAKMYGLSYMRIETLDDLKNLKPSFHHCLYEVMIEPKSSVASYEEFVDSFPLKFKIMKDYALL